MGFLRYCTECFQSSRTSEVMPDQEARIKGVIAQHDGEQPEIQFSDIPYSENTTRLFSSKRRVVECRSLDPTLFTHRCKNISCPLNNAYKG